MTIDEHPDATGTLSRERAVDAALAAANVMMRVAARSVIDVEAAVTTPQLRVLMLIRASGPQNLGQVAAELDVHPSNATRTCDKLVRAGYLARTEDPADRRFVHLALTPEGLAIVDHVLTARRSALTDVLSALPESDQESIAAAFSAFAAAAGGEPTHDGRFALELRS
ncbi:hypothetical protein GCM10027406_13580 [Leifsonia lichenia]